jgi:DNA-binding winged helix-turn-helix (wHTH) protein
MKPVTYRFADLRLKSDGTLLRGETVLEVPAQELALLRALLARQGELVSAGELNRALWGEAHPSSQRLTACLASLKKLLQPTDCIESVYRRGYRISAIAEPEEHLPSRSLPVLAILPFSTGFEVPEYVGLAVAEQTMEQLRSARPALVSIVARDSVLTLARRRLDAPQIGTMLHAELFLVGQLLATPGRYRLRAEMIRVEDGASLWVEDVIMEREQIAELAGELVNRVTSRLRAGGVLIQAEARPAVKRETSQAQREARELYLRAHHEWLSMERHRMQDAMGRLLRAVELDPALMAARVDLAQLAVLQCIYGYLSPRIAAATVRRATDGVPELNEQAEGLLPALGWVEFHFDRDARSALRMMARSAGLPYDATNTRARGWLLLSRRKFGEAIELVRATIQLDPYSPWLQAGLAWALHLAGERDASVAQVQKAIDVSSEFDNSLFFGAMILGHNGESARAIELAETFVARSSHHDLAISAHAYALACAGRAEESHELLERLQWLSRERFVLNTLNAATHVVLSDADAALEALRNANETRCPWFFQMLADPRLEPLKGRPEFAMLESSLAAMEADAASPSA